MPYKDPEKKREYMREYQRKYRKANIEKCRERTRKWRDANRELVRERGRERARIWRADNREKSREIVRRANKNRKERLKVKVFAMYGNECFLKDELCDGKLTIDHVNGKQFDGRGPKIKTRNTEVFYKWLTEQKRTGFVTLCSRHNWLKGGLPPHLMIEYAEKLQKLGDING